MTMKKQNDAVFQALVSVLAENGINFEAGMNAYAEIGDKPGLKESVIQIVTEGLMTGKVSFSDEAKKKHSTETAVKAYTKGMVDNHFRKDKRMNGGETYKIKNPGSRAGQGDEIVKNLRALLSTTTDESARESINSAINSRVEELKALKPKSNKKTTFTIDANKIPDELKYLIPQA